MDKISGDLTRERATTSPLAANDDLPPRSRSAIRLSAVGWGMVLIAVLSVGAWFVLAQATYHIAQGWLSASH